MDECNEPQIHSKILAIKFKEICLEFDIPYKSNSSTINLRRKENNNRVLNFIFRVAELIETEKCDRRTFLKELHNISKFIPLEIIWYLHLTKVMPLNEFIFYHEGRNNIDLINSVSSKLLDLCQEDKTKKQIAKEICCDFLSVIFNDDINNTNKISASFNNTIIHLITLEIQKNGITNLNKISKGASGVLNLIQGIHLTEQAQKSFNKGILLSLITGSSTTLQDIALKQQVLSYTNINEGTKSFFFKNFELLTSDEILALIKEKFLNDGNTINWDCMLHLLSLKGIHYSDGFSKLKNFVLQLLADSFKEFNFYKLSLAFIIARQCCFHRSSSFPGYLQWFGSNFSSESCRPINSIPSCTFFLKFLTDLAAYDLPFYHKIHINKVPHVPIECQSMLSDYIKLVKTRLQDLNESVELGFFENPTEKSAAEFDVESVLFHFQNTSEIPHCVLEATMFCKQYYEKKFLPLLLSSYDGKDSVRHKTILKLHSLGKIPNSLFLKYKHPL